MHKLYSMLKRNMLCLFKENLQFFWVTLFKVITSKVFTKSYMLSTINNKEEI